MTVAPDVVYQMVGNRAADTPPLPSAARVLAIDPGTEQSAYALLDWATRRPIETAIIPNRAVRSLLLGMTPGPVHVAIEMIASYGMAVGQDVFETCVWIGRFVECTPGPTELIYRSAVKVHHCHNNRAKDANIAQALIDRFASGQPNRGKGTKDAPGWFHGFAADIWQAYALGVYVADTRDAP